MTFSLLARDPATGSFGMVVSSSSPAVASRCLHLRAGVGAAASQNVTNPALGTAVLDALATGASASEAIDDARAADAFSQHRQLLAVDALGRVAHFSGSKTLGIHAVAVGDHAIAGGNLLAHEGVPLAMLEGYLAADGTLEERLLSAMRAAVGAGGEAGPIRSAGLSVVDGAPWRTTDLRVDDADDPLSELDRLVTLWLPQKLAYLTRATVPDTAPSYGVPGDS